MAIISGSKFSKFNQYGSTQFRYSMTYVLVTLAVLIVLNVYTSHTSQKLFYSSKEFSMLEKCNFAAAEIADLEVLNPATAAKAVERMNDMKVARMIITNQAGISVYDSRKMDSTLGDFVFFPEIAEAMQQNDVFTCFYREGNMRSHAACPIYSYDTLIGCVYIMEYDTSQATLLNSLQNNVLTITVVLEAVLLIFSFFYSSRFSHRLDKIMTSMHIIQDGDYTQKVDIAGHDELAFLGNEFNDLTDRLQESERKRRQFVSDASHELKTPLASIKLLSDSILQNEMDMDTVKEFVSDIGNEADRLNRMTLKLLSLSSIETSESNDYEIVHIVPTARRVMHMLSAIAARNNITLIPQWDQDFPILIMEDDLYQIIFNLVENGIKYNTPGGSLTIRLSQDGDNAMLQITDTGVGIPEESLSHIFERFYRVDKARARQSGGSGLGLAIVRNMVERNQGTISVESIMGKGTTFTVRFPIFDPDEEEQA